MYYAMTKYWRQYGPPVYLSVAGYLGLIKEKPKTKGGNLEELARMFASTGGVING